MSPMHCVLALFYHIHSSGNAVNQFLSILMRSRVGGPRPVEMTGSLCTLDHLVNIIHIIPISFLRVSLTFLNLEGAGQVVRISPPCQVGLCFHISGSLVMEQAMIGTLIPFQVARIDLHSLQRAGEER